MNSIHQEPPRTQAVGRAGISATTRPLRKALMVLVVAVAALASAIVLVLNPQPIPYLSQAPLACNGTESHDSPEVAMVRHMSRVSRSTDDIPNSQCA